MNICVKYVIIIHQPNIYSEARERSQEFKSKSFKITMISMFHPFYQVFDTTVPHKSLQPLPTHPFAHLPSPVSPFARSSAPENWCRFLPRSQNWNVGMEPRSVTLGSQISRDVAGKMGEVHKNVPSYWEIWEVFCYNPPHTVYGGCRKFL